MHEKANRSYTCLSALLGAGDGGGGDVAAAIRGSAAVVIRRCRADAKTVHDSVRVCMEKRTVTAC